MTRAEIEGLQGDLNAFTGKYLHNVAPLIVDGHFGQATRKRVRQCKFWLGYKHPFGSRVDERFRHQLRHPHRHKFSTAGELFRGHKRRVHSRHLQVKHERRAQRRTGVVMYDGRPVAAWMVPYFNWARTHKVNGRVWVGVVVSGFRDPAYSEHLCLIMCHMTSCPGRCAGRRSGHSQKVKPGGCADVSDYIHFGEAMKACPFHPRLINDLPIDRVHYSVTGH